MISASLAASDAWRPRRPAAYRHWRKVIPWRWLSLPALVLAFWAVAAKGFDAYLLYPWLDVPTHFSGGIAGVCCVDAFLLRLRPLTGRVHAAVRLALAFGLLACAAIGWEFLEYLSDFFLRTHLNLGVADTLSDLFFGLLGGGWGVAVRRYIDRHKSQSAMRQPRRRKTAIGHHHDAVNASATASDGTNGPNRAVNG